GPRRSALWSVTCERAVRLHFAESSMKRILPLALALLTFAACSNDNSTTTTSPTTTPTTVTETFQGVLTSHGSAVYFWPVQNTGSITAALITVSPDSTLVIGLSLGIWNGTSCNAIISNDQATQGTVIT